MTGEQKRMGAALAASALINLLFLVGISLASQGASPDMPGISRTSPLRVGLLPPVSREVPELQELSGPRNVASPVINSQKNASNTGKTEKLPALEPRPQQSEETEVTPEVLHRSAAASLAASLGERDPVDDTDLAASRAAAAGNPVEDLRSSFLIYLQNEIAEHQEYPRRAQKRGTQGTVVLFLQIQADGSLQSYTVERSSGSSILDRAAVHLIASIFPASRAPGRDLSCSISVEYRLN